MTHNLKLRQVTSTIREYLNRLDFLEVETPYLTKSTWRLGFLVPVWVFKISSTPCHRVQMLKQLLMELASSAIIGIVRCFRDEDLRGDQGQPGVYPGGPRTEFKPARKKSELWLKLMSRLLSRNLWFRSLTEDFPTISYDEAYEPFLASDIDDTLWFRAKEFDGFMPVQWILLIKKALDNQEEVMGIVPDG